MLSINPVFLQPVREPLSKHAQSGNCCNRQSRSPSLLHCYLFPLIFSQSHSLFPYIACILTPGFAKIISQVYSASTNYRRRLSQERRLRSSASNKFRRWRRMICQVWTTRRLWICPWCRWPSSPAPPHISTPQCGVQVRLANTPGRVYSSSCSQWYSAGCWQRERGKRLRG